MRVSPDGVIHIRNGGCPGSRDGLAGLQHRFVQGESRSAGAGLGVAIAETDMTRPAAGENCSCQRRGDDDGVQGAAADASRDGSKRPTKACNNKWESGRAIE
jgi:hypothetical protein